MKKVSEFHIIAMASHGEGISGGDRIYIEFARRWSNKFPITIHTWEEGKEMCERQKLDNKNIKFNIVDVALGKSGFILSYVSRIFEGINLGVNLDLENMEDIYIYNASEFWMDSIPCLILKLRHPKVKWIASWYQTAPNPFKGFTESERENKHKLRAMLYYLSQLPIKYLIKWKADKVLVNNKNEKKQFDQMNQRGDALVVIGAVPLEDIKKYTIKHKKQEKMFDAVFQGRFNAQKGVTELIEIWKKVVDEKPNAKLVMIGDGYLMSEVKNKIEELGLMGNVVLKGFLFDGSEKYEILAKSKIVLHPAFFDSGGMAAAEAMAFGLPCVGFDLPAYESYYPKGMVKAKKGDLNDFSKNILRLLDDKKFYNKMSKEAGELIENNYSWDKRASEILEKIAL